ncbi:MAG: glycosyltransferase [Erysipelotrichales bacterium]|nr:glycosyltransferase [Erysipelotrichales bacterium]
MGVKKKIFFVIETLGVGGAERSLLNLLQSLDYSKFEVSLQLFNLNGILVSQIPTQVVILPLPDIINLLNKNPKRIVNHPLILLKKFVYSLLVRFFRISHAGKAVLYWSLFESALKKNTQFYDIAIGYSQGIPTFYVIDKIRATKKFVWVNVDYKISGITKIYQSKYYKKATGIVTVSPFVKNFFSLTIFPDLYGKMKVIRDLIIPENIEKMASLPSDTCLKKDKIVIMTAGRLNKPQKGYDLAIEAAKILYDRGMKFRWYVVGEGPFRFEMENLIREYGLEENFILLGATSNPYAYMGQCDLYVQPSRHEGFGLTIAEALILNKPVICTNFEGCTMQMIHKKNGLITSFNPEDIAKAIELLINDKTLRSYINEFICNSKKGNIEELDKFYKLLEF